MSEPLQYAKEVKIVHKTKKGLHKWFVGVVLAATIPALIWEVYFRARPDAEAAKPSPRVELEPEEGKQEWIQSEFDQQKKASRKENNTLREEQKNTQEGKAIKPGQEPLPTEWVLPPSSPQQERALTMTPEAEQQQKLQREAQVKGAELIALQADKEKAFRPLSEEKKENTVTGQAFSPLGKETMPIISDAVLCQGSVIPVVLKNAITSDLPGPVIAEVTQDVKDCIQGRKTLVPMGAKVFGEYQPLMGVGQERLTLGFQRILFPDGKSLELNRAIAVDSRGQSGLSGKLDRRLMQNFVNNILLATFSNVVSDGGRGQLDREGATGVVMDASGQILLEQSRLLNQQVNKMMPRVEIPQGTVFHVMVMRDVDLGVSY